MKTKLFLMCVMAASAAYSGAAMPTEAEVEKAVPKVERMLASEKVALVISLCGALCLSRMPISE